MGFLKSKKGSIISEYFMLLENVARFGAGAAVDVALFEDHLELDLPLSKQQPVTLRYSQITDVYYGYEEEIVSKNKSVIGRAAAGGLVFGPAGAIVGAVSGSGKTEKKELHALFIISYTSSAGETSFLRFEDTRGFKGRKLYKKLKDLCGIKPASISNEL